MENGRILAVVATERLPAWLEPLLGATFFAGCSIHKDGNRTECNMFCLDCRDAAGAFCVSCRSARHEGHTVVQIRKSSYNNVVRVSEVEELIELNGVQTYVINSAKVVFLNERPLTTKNGSSSSSSSSVSGVGGGFNGARSVMHFCQICGRGLLEACRFCSLGCKLARFKRNGDTSFKLATPNNGGEEDDAMYQSPLPSPAPTSPPPPQPLVRSAGQSYRKKPRKGIPIRAALFS